MGRVGARVPTDGFGAHSSAHRTPTLENFYKKFKETVLGLGLKALSCLSSQDCGTVKHAEEGKGVSSLGGSLGSDGGRGGGVFQSLLGQTGVGQAPSSGSAGRKEHHFSHESRQQREPAPTCSALRGGVWPHRAPRGQPPLRAGSRGKGEGAWRLWL